VVGDATVVGWVGEIQPLVAAEWELEETVAGFELDLDAVLAHVIRAPEYEDIAGFPEVHEDLAVVVPDQVLAADVLDEVKRSGVPLLRRAEVFDVYRDPERVGEGHVSLALRLTYGAADRTLTDEEVASVRDAISSALSERLGGRVRAS
jgi:phenylalanyl-tRNA synthetase beta chain